MPLFHRRRDLRAARAAGARRRSGSATCTSTRRSRSSASASARSSRSPACSTRDARVLILDEPTATLSDVEIERIFACSAALRGQGRSVIYITHRLGEVFEICDSVTVLRNGELVGTRAGRRRSTRTRLIELMLGRSLGEMYPKPREAIRRRDRARCAGLTVAAAWYTTSISSPRAADHVHRRPDRLGRHRGRCGRSPGSLPDATGDGHASTARRCGSVRCRTRSRGNVQFISEDRAGEGMFLRSERCARIWSRRSSASTRGSACWRGAGCAAGARSLPQRSASIADALALAGRRSERRQSAEARIRPVARQRRAGVLLMNEPTRGVDVGARAEIYR